MIFKAKIPELIYFEKCLINPPVFPGTLPTNKYLEEISIEYLGHFKGINEVSEIIGEVWGGMCTQIVIGVCIAAVLSETGTEQEIKKINAAFEKLLSRQSELKGISPSPLNLEKVSAGAAKNLSYLISASQPNTVLQTEMSVSREIQEIRYDALKQFAPSVLRGHLFDGIEAMTGIRPSTK